LSTTLDIRDEGDRRATSPPPRFCVSGEAVPYILSTIDFIMVLLSSLAGGLAYHSLAGSMVPSLLPYCAAGSLAGVIYVLRMSGRGFYKFPDSAKQRLEAIDIISCWCMTVLLLAFVAQLLKVGADYSRGSFVLFCFLGLLSLMASRKTAKVALANAMSRRAVGRRHTVVLGVFEEMPLDEHLLSDLGAGEIKRFVLSDPGVSSGSFVDTSAFQAAAEFIRRNDCREILLALPWSDTKRIEFLRSRLKALPVAARLLPDRTVRSLADYSSSEQLRALSVNIQNAPLSDHQRLVKRILDVTLATLALIFFCPTMALTAVAIKLDSPGPVIFRQRRRGFNGKDFEIYKFRTMTVQENGPVVAQATRGDRRVTDIGQCLRSLSIDELPQLLNVLKGEMSLIGPRPHALAHDDHFEQLLSDYALRHHVKPGITGWAQCNGARGETPGVEKMSERVRLDLWYISNWSLKLDILILIKTCIEVFSRRNAY
jgi:undecaprenyl-phosphate galactose phosphotransferase/putative colanic acid biosynthesis UDP-glucose lipid carrier transferase